MGYLLSTVVSTTLIYLKLYNFVKVISYNYDSISVFNLNIDCDISSKFTYFQSSFNTLLFYMNLCHFLERMLFWCNENSACIIS